jgi:hypothetical protein
MTLKMLRSASFAGLCGLLFMQLVGCAAVFGSPIVGQRILTSIDAKLKPEESRGTAAVDLDQTVAGDWDRVVIVCRGATADSVTTALGFDWSAAPDPANPAFLGLLVFANGSRVDSYYLAGQDQDHNLVDHWYFSPCPTDADYQMSAPIVAERANSAARFTFERDASGDGYWYIRADDLSLFGQ